MTGIPGQGKGRIGHSPNPKGAHTTQSGWTDERVAELRRLVTIEGYSARRAAEALRRQGFEGVTRNSCVGKCHRMGIKMNKAGDMTSAAHNGGKPRPEAERRLHPRIKPPVERRAPPRATTRATAVIESSKDEPAPAPSMSILDAIEPRRVSIMQLTGLQYRECGPSSFASGSTCRFPIGEVRAPDFCYCGLPTEGRVYCGAHLRLALAIDQRRPFAT
jgi:hypothetical protein